MSQRGAKCWFLRRVLPDDYLASTEPVRPSTRRSMCCALAVHAVLLLGIIEITTHAPSQAVLWASAGDSTSMVLVDVAYAAPTAPASPPRPNQQATATPPSKKQAFVQNRAADDGDIDDGAQHTAFIPAALPSNAAIGRSDGNDDGNSTFRNIPLVMNASFGAPPTPPSYPARAVRENWQGTVIIRALIQQGGMGTPADIIIWQSSGHTVLDDAAAKAVKKWQFSSANGPQSANAPALWVQVPVNFQLQ